MKAIVDSCVWSLALRRRNTAQFSDVEQHALDQLRDLIRLRSAALIGAIRQEVLSGIRDDAQFLKTRDLLEPFRDQELIPADYVEAARLFNLCRKKGMECGPIDMLICAVALRLNFTVLTNDRGLLRCMALLRRDGLAL
jgi:predicted nucleic acid-binding protein